MSLLGMVSVALAVNCAGKVCCKWVTETGTEMETVIVSSPSGAVSSSTVRSKVVLPVVAPAERAMPVGAVLVKSLLPPCVAVPLATVTVTVVPPSGTDASGGRAKLTVMVCVLSEPSFSVAVVGERLRTAAGLARATDWPATSPFGQEVKELPPNRNSVREAVSCVTSKAPKDKSLSDKSNLVKPFCKTVAGTEPVRRLPAKSKLVKADKLPISFGMVPAIRFASTSRLGSTGNIL